MFYIKGLVVNTYTTPEGEKDGKKWGGAHKVQIQGKSLLRNGENRVELFTLSTEQPELFQEAEGKVVMCPIGIFVNERREMVHFIPKGSQVEVCA